MLRKLPYYRLRPGFCEPRRKDPRTPYFVRIPAGLRHLRVRCRSGCFTVTFVKMGYA